MWAAALNPRGLSQGDILTDVPVGAPRVPLTFVANRPYSSNRSPRGVWTQRDELEPLPNDQAGLWLAKGRITRALVITHNCDLDDSQDTVRILVAPIAPAAGIGDADARRRIIEGRRASFVGLPGVPGVGDCYADLRSIAPLDRQLFTEAARHCSMSDEAVVRLRAQLIHYFTRLEPAHLAAALASGLEAENNV